MIIQEGAFFRFLIKFFLKLLEFFLCLYPVVQYNALHFSLVKSQTLSERPMSTTEVSAA